MAHHTRIVSAIPENETDKPTCHIFKSNGDGSKAFFALNLHGPDPDGDYLSEYCYLDKAGLYALATAALAVAETLDEEV